jgi:hypothetical protein
MENILSLLKFCSFILVISSINGIRYFFLKRKLKFIYQEYRGEIQKAIGCDKIKVSSFIREPSETGNVMLDLLLFKTHRSVMWCILLLFFYLVSVIFLYLALRL